MIVVECLLFCAKLNQLFNKWQGAVIVHEVYDHGAAAKDSRLLPGDQILEVLVCT